MDVTPVSSGSIWRDRKYWNVEEHYKSPPSYTNKKGNSFLAIMYTIMALPVFLLIPLLFLSRQSTLIRRIFKVIHGFMLSVFIIKLLAVAGESDGISRISDDFTAAFFALAWFVLLTVIGFKYVGSYKASKHEDDTHARPLPSPSDLKTRGTFGDLSTARGKFSDANIENGEEGERRTALLLNDLLSIPGTRIFHGVAWPGTKDADIDHIVLNGNKIAFVDSKMWSQGLHVVNADGNVSTFGQPGSKVVFRQVKMPMAAQAMMRYLSHSGVGGLKPYSWLAVHNTRGTEVKTDNSRNIHARVRILDAKVAVDEIGDWFASDLSGVVYPRVVEKISKMLR